MSAKNNLVSYRVSLREEPDVDNEIHFECQAEDEGHAKEQAENAYPGCEVVSVEALPIKRLKRRIVIFVEGETEADVEEAFHEAVIRLDVGENCGSGSDESSCFSFSNDDASSETGLLVSLDGGVNFCPAPQGVRVHYTDMPHPEDDDSSTELQFNFSNEGVDIDVVDGEEILGTNSEIASDVVLTLIP